MSVGLSEEEADALYTHVLLSFEAWTKVRGDSGKAPFTVKRGTDLGGGRTLARSLEVVPEGQVGGPAVCIRRGSGTRDGLMEGAQKVIKPTLVLRQRGGVLVCNEAARARAIERDKVSAEQNRADLEREAAFMAEMSARAPQGVLPLVATYQLPRRGSIAGPGLVPRPGSKRIVLSEMMSGSVDALLVEGARPKDEAGQRELMLKAARALADLHAQGILHNDVKENNFFYSGPAYAPRIVIADFALSAKLEHGRAVGRVGSPVYASPGALVRPGLDEDGNVALTTANDVWALGVMFHRVVTGSLPSFLGVDGEAREPRFHSIERLAVRATLALLGLEKVHVERALPDGPFRTLLSGMLEVDDERRWTLDEVIRHLEAGRTAAPAGTHSAEPLSSYLASRALTKRQVLYAMNALAQQVLRFHAGRELQVPVDFAQVFVHRPGGRVRFGVEPSSSPSSLPGISSVSSVLSRESQGALANEETPFTEEDRDEIASLAGLDRDEAPTDSAAPLASQQSVNRLHDVSEAAGLKMKAIRELARAEDVRALGKVFDVLRGHLASHGIALPSEIEGLVTAMIHPSPHERPDIVEVARTITRND